MKTKLITLFLCLCPLLLIAQDYKKEGDELFQEAQYEKAIKKYNAYIAFAGERPPRSMSIGNTMVYYHEMSSSSVSRGGVEYKQCTGDVWVIYRSASDAKRLQFQTTNGSVQTCNDF